MNLDPKVQRIITWRESLATLPDAVFFDIIRMYLGEVKTPFNKQKLIEELSSFLRKDANKQMLVKFLDEDDLRIIAAIRYIPQLTQHKLESFFARSYPYASLYEHIVSLEERLVVYAHSDGLTGERVFAVNPLLEDVIEPFVSIALLLPVPPAEEPAAPPPLLLTPARLCSFISYIIVHPEICKADGSLKKKNAAELEDIFGSTEGMPQLFAAFCNLGLLREAEKGWAPDWGQLESFATLAPQEQYTYLCAAAAGHFSRGTMQVNAQLLLDVLLSIPSGGYARETLLWLAFLIREQGAGTEGRGQGRFARMLASHTSVPGTESGGDGGIMDSMIDNCIAFGVLYARGRSGSDVFALSPAFREAKKPSRKEEHSQSCLSIDAGFGVTVLPGMSFAELLPLMKFLSVLRCDTAATFSLDRASAMRAFDAGVVPDDISGTLRRFSSFELPQNLLVSVQDWYNSYSSAALYKGYVLKVAADKAVFVEKNPTAARHILCRLSPEIFLMDFADDREAQAVIKRCGLDFVGSVKGSSTQRTALGLFPLRCGGSTLVPAASAKPASPCPAAERDAALLALREKLDAQKLPADQAEELLERINRRIVVNAEQLRGGSVRFEKLEAGGMDYAGKLHVIDSAMSSKSLVEVETEDAPAPFVGTPISLSRKENDTEFVLALVPDGTERVFSAAQAVRVKKLRTVGLQF